MRLKHVMRLLLSVILLSANTSFAGVGIEGNDVITKPKKDLRDGGLKFIRKTKTIVVPTFQVKFLKSGDAYASAEVRGGGNVHAHSQYIVQGLTNEEARAIAKSLYDDFVQKLRDNGFTVQTYEDVKDQVAEIDRYKPNERTGMPMDKEGTENFMVASPSPEQDFKPALQGPHWPFRKVGDKQTSVVIPIYTVRAPRPQASSQKGYSGSSASVAVAPFLAYTAPNGFAVWFIKGGAGGILGNNEFFRISENVGQVVELDDKSPELGNAVSDLLSFMGGGGSVKKKFKVFAFNIDKEAYTAAVMKGALAFNDIFARAAADEQK